MTIAKTYFTKSPYASIEKLSDGSFEVVNHVDGCTRYKCGKSWFNAQAQREVLINKYKSILRGR
jgi:hypothetical protein